MVPRRAIVLFVSVVLAGVSLMAPPAGGQQTLRIGELAALTGGIAPAPRRSP